MPRRPGFTRRRWRSIISRFSRLPAEIVKPIIWAVALAIGPGNILAINDPSLKPLTVAVSANCSRAVFSAATVHAHGLGDRRRGTRVGFGRMYAAWRVWRRIR